MTKTIKKTDDQVHQGDIYREIDCIEYANVNDGIVDISKIHYQYVMVLSQECDLTQDYNERVNIIQQQPITYDKILQNIIVVPLFNYEHFKAGLHLSNIGFSMATDFSNQKKTPAKILMQNNNPRYHYLEFNESVDIVPSVIDFKRFFTIDANAFYKIQAAHYVCSVDQLFRERISQRFANFISRIGLPVN